MGLPMLMQLAFAFGLTCATVIVHALGTLEVIAHVARKRDQRRDEPGLLAAEIQVIRMVSVLMLLHLIEACLWASVYVFAGLLPDFETAIYFSVTSYTTVGYGDVVLPASSRLLGPIEAGVGILMFGWSTGIMVTALSRIYRDQLQSARGDPGRA